MAWYKSAFLTSKKAAAKIVGFRNWNCVKKFLKHIEFDEIKWYNDVTFYIWKDKAMKRILSLLLAAVAAFAVCLTLGSCDNDHTHKYKTEWSSDEDFHWYACESDSIRWSFRTPISRAVVVMYGVIGNIILLCFYLCFLGK